MHVCFLASDFLTKCLCNAFLVTCHFQKFVVFLAVNMAAHEEWITPIYTFFCLVWSFGKTSIGYKTLFEQIKNSLCLEFFKSCSRLIRGLPVKIFDFKFLAEFFSAKFRHCSFRHVSCSQFTLHCGEPEMTLSSLGRFELIHWFWALRPYVTTSIAGTIEKKVAILLLVV